jgi:hypothetical protein
VKSAASAHTTAVTATICPGEIVATKTKKP